MEVPAGHDGIQRLLAAEQDAQAVVAAARQGVMRLGFYVVGMLLVDLG